MSFGLRVFRGDGALTLDTNTFTYQIIGQWVMDFSASTPANPVVITLNIPGFNPSTCAFFLLPTRPEDIPSESDPSNAKSYPYVTVAAGQVVTRAKNPLAVTATLPCRAILRGMAVRYN